MKQPTFSVILPLYKQKNHVVGLIKEYVKALDSLQDTWELLLIVNGVDDGAVEVAKKNVPNGKNVHVHFLEKGGWGRAVKYGLEHAKGHFLCYTNSARTEVKDLVAILKYAKVNDEVFLKATRIIRESWIRKIGSTLYNLENRLLFKTAVWDVNGTPKVLPRNIYESFTITSDDDLIDAEVVAKISKRKIPIFEYPIVSLTRLEGKSTTNWKSAYNMYRGLLRLHNSMKRDDNK